MTAYTAYTKTLDFFAADNTATQENDIQQAVIEALVDRFGLGPILSAMADMCEAKVEHLSTNWQDANAGRSEYARAAKKITKLAVEL